MFYSYTVYFVYLGSRHKVFRKKYNLSYILYIPVLYIFLNLYLGKIYKKISYPVAMKVAQVFMIFGD